MQTVDQRRMSSFLMDCYVMFKTRTTSSNRSRRSKFSKRGLLLESLETRMCLAADPAFLPGEVLIQFSADASDQVRQEVLQ